MRILPLVALALGSCVGTATISATSGLSQHELSAIPKGATEVIIIGEDRSQLYERIVDALIQRGHRINREDKERFYVTTEGKDVGESTLQRMTIVVNEDSKAVIKSEWMPGQEAVSMATALSGIPQSASWSKASFEGGRSGIAYAEAVAVGKLTGFAIEYR